MAILIAFFKQFGPQALVLVEYLLAHKDDISKIIELLAVLLPLLGITVPAGKTAPSDGEFIDACRKAGASTGDAQELLAALPE